MKKGLLVVLALIMVLGLVGCGKSKEATTVDELISAIGNVTLESGDSIQSARESYNALNEEQQSEIENINLLTDAEKAFVELAKNESNVRMLEKNTNEAIEILKEALPFDSTVQENIDIIYSHCFDFNGVLLINPSLLYTGVELVGISPNDSEHELDSYFYSPVTADIFTDYVKYTQTLFTINDEETLESDNFIRYQFIDKASGAIALELSLFMANGEVTMGIAVLPNTGVNIQYGE